MKESVNIRPTTGRLLVGGDFYKHVGYGIGQSWLAAPNPLEYLFSDKHFGTDPDGLGQRFLLPAMQTALPNILLDFPMARDNHAIKMSQGLSVLYLPEGRPWIAARCIVVLSWKDDMEVDDGGNAWRKWDTEWFLTKIRSELTQQSAELQSKHDGLSVELSEANEILASI